MKNEKPIFCFLLLSMLMLLLPGTIWAQSSSDFYPTNSSSIARLRFSYPFIIGTDTPTTGPNFCYWRLKPGVTSNGAGGWVRIDAIDDNPPNTADIPGGPSNRQIFFPIGYEYDSFRRFLANIPPAVRDKINITVQLRAKPHYDPFVSQPDIRTFSLSLGMIERNYSGPVFLPWTMTRWIDQDVAMRIEVRLDNSITYDSSRVLVFDMRERQLSNGTRVPAMRTIKSPLNQLSPYLLPVAIIGRPPGNQSWSSLTTNSGAGATLAISERNSTSVTTEESVGFGPFSIQSPTETNWRGTTRGIHQTFSSSFALGVKTNNPYRPGEGDVMLCLNRPSFNLFRAYRDMDFRYIHPSTSGQAPKIVAFPMRELLSPQPGTPPAMLTPVELQALRDLNPLLSDPHAVLREPRYYHVLSLAMPGTSVSGGAQIQGVTRAQVENALGHSTTVIESESFTLPIGSIAGAARSPLPYPDFLFRYTETTTSNVEFKTDHTLEQTSGTLIEFVISDSDPAKWLYTDVYYDTFFRTFAFRDAAPPPRRQFFEQVRQEFNLEQNVLNSWRAIRINNSDIRFAADGEKGATQPPAEFVVVGSLSKWGLLSGMVEFYPLEKKGGVCYRASILPKTGNIMIPNLRSGKYQVLLSNKRFLLELSPEGEVTFKPES